MDPVTQGALGATLAQANSRPQYLAWAGLFGLLGGMAPDLDVLIRSSSDPLLFLEYHRQFTHSLIFIPIGGALCGLLLFCLLGRFSDLSLKQSIGFTTLGYATHALLDASTTYGTQLPWPFSDQRFAWNAMPIIDPIYTLTLIGLLLTATFRKKPAFARIALVWMLAYPLLGVWQRERAETLGWALAQQRGHQPLRLEAKPSFANLWVWKIVYETEQRYYIDAVRVTLDSTLYEGESVARLDLATDFPWLDKNSQQAKDIERFRWFSNGYIARDPQRPNRIIDVRYSLVPNRVDALWGIELQANATRDQHSSYVTRHQRTEQHQQAFIDMLLGR